MKINICQTKSSITLILYEYFAIMKFQYDGTFEDYLEMFIQFGYVILFSSAYPLAGLCALINNIIEIRGDAFKLCHVHQRPFGQRVNNIGSWQVQNINKIYSIFCATKFYLCVKVCCSIRINVYIIFLLIRPQWSLWVLLESLLIAL